MQIQDNVPLATLTTIGVGGKARWYAACSKVEEAIECLKWARSKGLPAFILGGGSNTLFSDEGFLGLIVHLKTSGIDWANPDRIAVQAGEEWDSFVSKAVAKALSGIECLAGIPGTVGATPIQNVGAYGQDVSQTIVQVNAIDRTSLDAISFDSRNCEFSYRHSRFKGRDKGRFLITEVIFCLSPIAEPQISYPELQDQLVLQGHAPASRAAYLDTIRKAVLKIRASKGMVVNAEDPDSRSLGSFFTNPVLNQKQKEALEQVVLARKLRMPPFFPAGETLWKTSAAWLIENSGSRRGETLNGAAVSSKHSLALVNRNQALCSDIISLANLVRSRVKAQFDISLEIEPEIILGP